MTTTKRAYKLRILWSSFSDLSRPALFWHCGCLSEEKHESHSTLLPNMKKWGYSPILDAFAQQTSSLFLVSLTYNNGVLLNSICDLLLYPKRWSSLLLLLPSRSRHQMLGSLELSVCLPWQTVESEEFVAHASSVNCLKIGRKTSRVLVTGGEDHKVNLWAIGKPNAILVSNPTSQTSIISERLSFPVL